MLQHRENELWNSENGLRGSSLFPDGTRTLGYMKNGKMNVWDFSSDPGVLATWLTK